MRRIPPEDLCLKGLRVYEADCLNAPHEIEPPRSPRFPSAGRTPDQQDAFTTAEWLRRADCDGSLEKFFCLELDPHERETAEIEGWILGVT